MTHMRERGARCDTASRSSRGSPPASWPVREPARVRYEQMKKAGRKVVESPAVKQAARAAGEKATELSKAAGRKAAERMPKITETAKTSATKVRGQLDRIPGRHSDDPEHVTVNGSRPID
jgi:hypothetical protein